MPEIAQLHQERRHHPRTQLQVQLQCIRLDPDGGDVVMKLETIDISRSGVGVVSDRQFYPGQRVLLCMPLSSMGERRNICATVVRCRQREDGYSVGMEFDRAAMNLWYSEPLVHAAA